MDHRQYNDTASGQCESAPTHQELHKPVILCFDEKGLNKIHGIQLLDVGEQVWYSE